MEFVATFYSHFGAVRFQKAVKSAGLSGRMTPVPRKVSSSCGTCVIFEADSFEPFLSKDVEGVYQKDGMDYVCLWDNPDL